MAPAAGRWPRAAARALFGPELKRLGWEPRAGEPATDARQRAALIGPLARFGDPAVIAEAGRVAACIRLPAAVREHEAQHMLASY